MEKDVSFTTRDGKKVSFKAKTMTVVAKPEHEVKLQDKDKEPREKKSVRTLSLEVCEECGNRLRKFKWDSPQYPADDFYGMFCANPDCVLYRECQMTDGEPPTRLVFHCKDKKGNFKEPKKHDRKKEKQVA